MKLVGGKQINLVATKKALLVVLCFCLSKLFTTFFLLIIRLNMILFATTKQLSY